MVLDRTEIATAPRIAHAGTAYRNQSPRYDPRSGEGARLHGGRFNPPGSFPTLYLCETRGCVVAELTRYGTRHVVGVEGLLPRVLYRYEFDLCGCSTSPARTVNTYPHWHHRRPVRRRRLARVPAVGAEAHAVGDQAIRTSSATGIDTVLVIFPELLGASLTEVELAARWDDLADLA